MFYELRITWRTICKEGIGSLFSKVSNCFGDLAPAAVFLLAAGPLAGFGKNFLNSGCQISAEKITGS